MVTQIQLSRHAIKEGHGKQLYCVAWSSDSFTESSTSDNNVVTISNFTNGNEKDPDHHVTDHNIESEEASKEHENQGNSQEFNDNLIHDTGSTDTAIYHCFATCGSYYLTIYQIDTFNRNSTMEVKQIYKDSDDGEIYYACVFAGRCKRLDKDIFDGTKKMLNGEIDIDASKISIDSYIYQEIDEKNMGRCPQLCLVGGKRGTIKVIDTIQQSLVATLTGHCDELYDLKLCPTNEWLFLSAANDETIRLWNLKTPACIAIFAGHKGHRDAILSLDWHPSGDCFASGGFDQTVKVWSCKHNEIQKSIRDSFSTKGTTRFPTVIQQFPIFNTSKMHSDYVDCVQWVGNMIVSKSTTNVISVWKPRLNGDLSFDDTNDFEHLYDFKLQGCNAWFLRFAIDKNYRFMAIGNDVGDLKIWRLGESKKQTNLINSHSSSLIRMVSFSPNGKVLIGVRDDSTVWKYNIEQ